MKKLLFLSLVLILMTACPDNHVNEGCDFPYYVFDFPVSFTPADSIINIGDTITVTSTIPREKKDNRFNLIFLLDSVDFHMGGGIIRLDTLIEKGKHYHFMDNFEWIVDSIYIFKKGNNAYGFDYYYS